MQRTTSEEVVVPKVLVLYYSAYGHIERMAQAVAEGARETDASVDIKRVPELVPAEVAKPLTARWIRPLLSLPSPIPAISNAFAGLFGKILNHTPMLPQRVLAALK